MNRRALEQINAVVDSIPKDVPKIERAIPAPASITKPVGGGGTHKKMSIPVDAELHEELSIAAIKLDATRSSIVLQALRDWLQNYRASN